MRDTAGHSPNEQWPPPIRVGKKNRRTFRFLGLEGPVVSEGNGPVSILRKVLKGTRRLRCPVFRRGLSDCLGLCVKLANRTSEAKKLTGTPWCWRLSHNSKSEEERSSNAFAGN